VSALLAVVGELKLLHELKLVVDFRDDGDEQDVEVEAVPSAAFAALTASSQLRVLHVELSHDTEVALPGPDVLRHMFPAGRRLGQLHTLVLGSVQYCTSQWRVPLAALARIAASCPAVQTLSLVDVFEEGRQRRLLPLLDLTMLSSLRVGGAAWNDSAAGVVAQLTQLTSLEWVLTQGWYSNALGDPIKDYQLTRTGLAQLVSLERLQYCSIDQAEALTQTPLLDFELKFLPEFTSSDQVCCWQVDALQQVPEPTLHNDTLACLPSFQPAPCTH
jgi:hypothetical protein